MKFIHRHSWNLSIPEAIALQKELEAEIIDTQPLNFSAIRYVAGVDVSVQDNVSQAAVVVLRYPELEPVETALAKMPTPFPYVPGLLSFREGPVLEMAFEKLQIEPDVFIFDGMGATHTRRIGIACHLGLWLQRPTIGCGKTLFVGEYVEPAPQKGSYEALIDKGETIGNILRTRDNVKPVFISVGHLADLASATELALNCTTKYRLPEPIRCADSAAGVF
jgi:deoxyribonuclease V